MPTFKINLSLLSILAILNFQSLQSSVLIDAAQQYDYKQVESLLKNMSAAELDIQNNNGETALMIAAKNKDSTIFKLIFPHLIIPEKCCFLTFERDDPNRAITDDLYSALLMRIVSIATPTILKKCFEIYPFIHLRCATGSFTLLADEKEELIVIIPESLQPSMQLEAGTIKTFIDRYGFMNLHRLSLEKFDSMSEKKLGEINVASQLATFGKLINAQSAGHPTRFYLDGHGSTNQKIAGIPTDKLLEFLGILVLNDAEFLYISSCYAAGINLQIMQKSIATIVALQIDKKTPPGIDYAIVLQATAGIPSGGFGNAKAMFLKLNKFLQDPVWALDFGPGVTRPSITIIDVISALNLSRIDSLPSLRLPGKTSYFRSLNIGHTEIITESMLIEKGVERTLQLLGQSAGTDKNVAGAAKKKLSKPLDIEIRIKPDIQSIQIFPVDLTDFTFVIEGQNVPQFISKLTNTGQHFIGTIKCHDTLLRNFVYAFSYSLQFPAETPHCWFIKSFDSTLQNLPPHCTRLAIKVDATVNISYAYITPMGLFIISKTYGEQEEVDKKTFESTVQQWFNETIPSQATLTEATGGMEIIAEEKARLEKEKVEGGLQAFRRFQEPRFARTPEDLFNIFMTD